MQKARTMVKTLVHCIFKCCIVIIYSRIPVGKKRIDGKGSKLIRKQSKTQGKMILTRGGNDLRK